ncbi:PD-(D/E)XK nuclease family protein [Sulfidibacter corallicola]|uniref:PD-(D/E)XK nuclease family protein n=1 Tax=Sulfidibacter corallicola TaxID=2818388 RepID=A0A8A4TXF9_SULCO|nr:PD-(D/E)XK nuclease family protein [Sulfidibacter corallicola]QTD54163.1 PD-(D/E)XK nuclease family protein [Sulfidibacter corallicola]
MKPKTLITYSQLATFLSCRQKMRWRYIEELVPLERAQALSFGSLIHDCLESWHSQQDLPAVLDHIDRIYSDRATDEKQRADWHLATAMMKGYVKRYPTEDFEIMALEKKFEGPIVNPKSGRVSRSFRFAGKVDGIVKRGDDHFLLETKTASQVDAAYLERLWRDFQISIYSLYARRVWGLEIKGVIYNVLCKARLQQSRGETEAEFEARRAALIAKSKTGRSSAKRRLPESDEAFKDRLAAKYDEPGMFVREEVLFTQGDLQQVAGEIWDLTQALLEARRANAYLPNRGACYQYGRACAYLPLCQSPDNEHLIPTFYERQPPHSELAEEPAAAEAPIF